MAVSVLLIGLVSALCLFQLNSVFALGVSLDSLNQRSSFTGAWAGTEASSVKCKLQGSIHLPAFSMDGDFIIGGAFSLHSYTQTVSHDYTIMPEPLQLSHAMVFAIEEINNNTELLPGIRLGYQIYDSCASVSMTVPFNIPQVNTLIFFFQTRCLKYACTSAVLIGLPFVVAFASSGDMKILFEELSREPFPPRQWIGSESWVTNPGLRKYSFLAGTIGFGIQKSVIPGFRNFLLNLSFAQVAVSPLLTEFWEDSFNCTIKESEKHFSFFKVCNGTEDIKTLQTPYTDTSQLRISNMVYKAVYAIAHAIHNALCQGRNVTAQCDKLTKLQSKQVSKNESLKKVNFSRNGYDVSFDTNGDPVAIYELVNWQKTMAGITDIVTVGLYDASLPEGQEFQINKNIIWMEGSTKVPVSVCSGSCPPGTRKVLQKGKPICCYDCTACPEGEISNTTGKVKCLSVHVKCFYDANLDTCIPKPIEFLSFQDILGIILATFSVLGACLTIITTAIFLRHRTSPIVRANNSELSFLLLISLTLCFLCSITFIGAPSEWSCMLRHTAFGITFVLCISCVLGKTIVVLMAFKARLPGSNVMKWFGPPQQRMTVMSFTFIQVLICTIWLVLSPPFPIKNLTAYKEKIILECALGSAVGFWAVLGYIGLLAAFCFVLAVLARKLPDNFNEAKLITFSMLIFCAVWITFIPAYVSSPGKFTVVVEIFAILASSFGLIMCIFAPKCFIILFKPEKNTKKHLLYIF
uniref:G-protein coupled receptors family 3 profile domain-containing protein n=1 Tax=Astatotilapia calliptera TaxID=8154 RepID=A0A3P8PHK3_ASTCA